MHGHVEKLEYLKVVAAGGQDVQFVDVVMHVRQEGWHYTQAFTPLSKYDCWHGQVVPTVSL